MTSGLPLLVLLAALLFLPVQALAASEEAVLAGGCFWCLEHDLETVPGVIDVESGYSGGELASPTYPQVSQGDTGHQESVRVRFDNTRLSYPALLRIYWRNIDPFDRRGQFCDKGDSYRAVIFPDGPDQNLQARESLAAAARELGKPPPRFRWNFDRSAVSGPRRPTTRTTPAAMGPGTASTGFPAVGIGGWRRSGGQGPGRGMAGNEADLRLQPSKKRLACQSR
jgi:methionine-S-sulfoxide reductase